MTLLPLPFLTLSSPRQGRSHSRSARTRARSAATTPPPSALAPPAIHPSSVLSEPTSPVAGTAITWLTMSRTQIGRGFANGVLTCLASSLAAALCASSITFLRSATGVTTCSPLLVSVGVAVDPAAAFAACAGWEGEETAGRMEDGATVGAAVEDSAAVGGGEGGGDAEDGGGATSSTGSSVRGCVKHNFSASCSIARLPALVHPWAHRSVLRMPSRINWCHETSSSTDCQYRDAYVGRDVGTCSVSGG